MPSPQDCLSGFGVSLCQPPKKKKPRGVTVRLCCVLVGTSMDGLPLEPLQPSMTTFPKAVPSRRPFRLDSGSLRPFLEWNIHLLTVLPFSNMPLLRDASLCASGPLALQRHGSLLCVHVFCPHPFKSFITATHPERRQQC